MTFLCFLFLFPPLFPSEILRYDSIPKEMASESVDRRQELVEAVSNVDDQLGEMFLEERKPTDEQLMVRDDHFCLLSQKLGFF